MANRLKAAVESTEAQVTNEHAHSKRERDSTVCPVMLTDACNITLCTTHHTLYRDAGAICSILHIGNFSLLKPHRTQAPAVPVQRARE